MSQTQHTVLCKLTQHMSQCKKNLQSIKITMFLVDFLFYIFKQTAGYGFYITFTTRQNKMVKIK